jgi:SET and MYND domain-containing protein 4
MKCEETAEKFRSEGNLHFRNRDYHQALLAYNQSLCYAQANDLSLAYANRSAVYLEAKLYDECLENIKLARDLGYPKEKLEKLNERNQKCKKLMKTHQKDPGNEPWNFFKLSHSPNKKIPFIINCLELCENEKYGRYLITKKNLKTGDVIAIEEPFYKFIDNGVYHSRCANCLKSNHLNLTPCALCTKGKICIIHEA